MSISTSKRIEIFNKIVVFIAIISLTLGLLAFYITKYMPQLYLELFIGITFLIIPFLNKVSFNIRMLVVYVILCSALVFYGIILGLIAQIHILVAFLVGAALLLIESKPARIFALVYVGLMVVFLELSYYNQWFAPLKMEFQTQMFIRWIVIGTGSALNLVVIYFYFKEWNSDRNSKLVDQLQRANELKSIYVRETTHELRTPVSNLLNILEHLYEADPDTKIEEYKIHIEDAYATITQAVDICDNVLQLSKKEAGIQDKLNLKEFSLKDWLNRNVQINQYRANNSFIKIEIQPLPVDVPETILSDPGKLNQILNNIITNAIKYSNKYSTITIELSIPGPRQWRLTISDKGPGISSEKIDQLFLPFFTEGTGYESNGLGLPITKGLIENLGGTIHIQSVVDEGTTVIVTLPLLRPIKTAASLDMDEQLVPDAFGNKTVLIIEDDPLQQKHLMLILQPIFKQVSLADNGFQGLNLAVLQQPDFIMLDGTLSDISGKEVLKNLKSDPKTSKITVFIVSADTDSDYRFEMLDAGAEDFIAKPYSSKLIKERLKDAVDKQKAN